MSEKTYTSVLHAEIGGARLPDKLAVLLVEGWVDSSVNVPSAFQLTFVDSGGDILQKFRQIKVGAEAVLCPFTDGVRGKPMLTGEVTALEVDSDASGKTLVVRGYDPGHRLLRNRRVQGYPNMTASDIVRRVAGLNRLKIGKIESTPTVYELATQPNITDWDFLSRLAQENDSRLSFDEDGKLNFAGLKPAAGAPADTTPSAQSPYVLEFGHNALHSRVAVTASGQVSTAGARGWDVRSKRALSSTSPATVSKDIDADITPAQLSQPFGKSELTSTQTPYTTQAQVRHAAKSLADDVSGSFAELEVAVTGNPDLQPGRPVALKGAGFPFEGKYTATGVRHVFESGRPFTTWLTVSGRQFRSLYGLASGGADAAPPMPGVAMALVSNAKDPMKMNRVKLRFPWLSDTYESDWCRIAQLGGVRGGGLMMPEVGDEVLVAFDRGSLEHPYVLAGLYNGRDKPTPNTDGLQPIDPTSGRVNWRSISSRSGHTMELVDAKSRMKSGIRLQTGNGRLTVHMDETKTSVTIKSDGSVSITGTRNVSIKAGGNLSLTAGGSLTMSAGGAVDIKAGAKFGVMAGAAADINATGAISLKSAGAVAVNSVGAVSVTAVGAVAVSAGAAAAISSPATVALSAPAVLRNGIPF
ncbi:VgrG-related protein [Streptomyces kanamyceticus]|uniref:Type IV secretion protein Rhs n=1 Tax=Streptomyces kanamyceticus TaxID=1967 RepID=A0A5J6G7S4_STRKN|nr:VgrG-related protein [Streptomyces kanamyceticus]QEU91830.1 type IV secretion protein Rhs [Streptomyces kanamyceticus]